MFSQHAQLSQYQEQLTQEQQAAFARQLIVANEHYRLSNTDDVALDARQHHRLQARTLAEDVAGRDPSNAAALNLLGRIALDDSNMGDAAGYMLSAIELEPENSNYHVNLGYVRLAARDYEQAERLFSAALQLIPNNAQAYAGLAYVFLRKGESLGAFMRLRSLVQKGYTHAYCRRALFEAAQNLWADQYDAELDRDLQTYFGWTDLDAFQLGNITSSLLVHKYDLSNENALLDLDTLVQDPLLLSALHRSLLPNRLVESLLTNLRRAVMLEIFETRYLRESLQPVVCALAVYGARTGYAFAATYDEQTALNHLQLELQDFFTNRQWQQQDCIAALLLVSMYEPLYTQPYSFQLLRDDLTDWPEAAQPVLRSALYEPADHHALEYDIAGGKSADELAGTPLVRGASPKWETLGMHPQADYRASLAQELGSQLLPVANDRPLQILVTGCRSGQRAVSLAQFFTGVEVTAIDANLDNIVHGVRASQRYGLNNMSFACAGLQNVEQAGAVFDVIECGTALGPVEQVADNMRRLASLLSPTGVIRFTLPRRTGRRDIEEARNKLKENDILPTAENLRTVRQIMLEEAAQGMWQEIVGQPEFYTLPGTRDLLFAEDEPSFNLRDVHELLQVAGLEFLGFVDLDASSRQRVRALNPRDLMAWHNLDESHQTVFTDSYEIYCRKA